MYYYIFDQPQGSNEYQLAATVKDRLSSFGIAGEMTSPMPGKGVEQLVQAAIAKRYATIVAVGGIQLINQVAKTVEPYDLVMGIIPLHPDPDVSRLIGAETWEAATEQLKRRLWQPVSLGLMNGTDCFLTPATITVPAGQKLTVKTDKLTLHDVGRTIEVAPGHTMENDARLIVRLGEGEKKRKGGGFLGGLMKKKDAAPLGSVLPAAEVSITTEEPLPVIVAGNEMASTPVHFGSHAHPIRLIVHKSA